MAFKICGKEMRSDIYKDLFKECDSVKDCCSLGGKQPKLAIINVRPSKSFGSTVYNWKQELCFQFSYYNFPETVEIEELLKLVDILNEDDGVHGVLFQYSSKSELIMSYRAEILHRIDPRKEVCGVSQRRRGTKEYEVSFILAVTYILKKYKIRLLFHQVGIVFIKNKLTAKLSKEIRKLVERQQNATLERRRPNFRVFVLTTADAHNLEEFCKSMDVLICGSDEPKIITADMIKPGATIIDTGCFHDKEISGLVYGTTDCENVEGIKLYPSPGSFSKITEAFRLNNFVKSMHMQNKKEATEAAGNLTDVL